MARVGPRAWLRLILPLALPALLLVTLRSSPDLDAVYQNGNFHLVFVSAIAACALAIAVVAAVAGARTRHHGPIWLACACLAVGVLMLGHGLVTPGVRGTPFNQWVGRFPYAAITAFAIALGLAARPRNVATSRVAQRRPAVTLAVVGGTLALFVVTVLRDPLILHGAAPVGGEDEIRWAVVLVTSALLLLLTRIHWRRWLLGHDPVQYALVLSATLSVAALVALRVGELWRLSWWDYHGFLLAGFGGAVYAVWIRYRRTKAIGDLLASTFEVDPMTHIVHGYPDALRTLVRAVEVKDSYTHGHSERTAAVSVQLGLRLGFDETTLRALARGAYLHDVGKIAVPDAILNKPGALTADERAIIETHPKVGYELVAPLPELGEALPVVLHHHERWDGKGYPDGLAATRVPRIARVAAVADVWDALTSDRSYRKGMAPAVALAHIVAGKGTHFDPDVVDSMVALAADWGYHADRNGGRADEAWRAAETCHESMASTA